MIRTLLLAALAAVLPASAQTPDTTGAWRYFPLALGNVWEYEVARGSDLLALRRHAVTADTVVDGERFFRIEWTETDRAGRPVADARVSLARFDTTLGGLRSIAAEGDLLDNVVYECGALGAPFGTDPYEDGLIECVLGPSYGPGAGVTVGGGYGRTVEVGGDVVRTSVKAVDTQGAGEALTWYAAGVGYLGYVARGAGRLTLRYARVGGVEVGTPFPVSSAAPPPPPLGLRAYPNPASHVLTVEVAATGAGRVAVYDVLGRRVRTVCDGACGPGAFAVDVAGLPPAVYVVREEGSGRGVAVVVR